MVTLQQEQQIESIFQEFIKGRYAKARKLSLDSLQINPLFLRQLAEHLQWTIVRSEGKSGFHSSEGNIRYDAVLVCRKQPSDWSENHWSGIKQQILGDAIDWTRRTLESGMAINRVDVFTIVMAKSVEHVIKSWANLNNRACPVKIATLLKELEEIVDDVAHRSQAGLKPQQKAYSYEVEQLALFLRESEARCGA
jgi:hypothetical protein